MPVNLSNKTPIDESRKDVQQWLRNLQGNILRGHGRDFGVYIFFSFGRDAQVAKHTLQDLAGRYVTSALKQYEDTVQYRRLKIPGPLFGNLFLTASGYRNLGLDPAKHFVEPGEEPPDTQDPISMFVRSMRDTARDDFADPPLAHWDEGFRKPIDAMLLLADDDEGYLMRQARDIVREIGRTHVVRATEVGRALRNVKGDGIEHFGYVDGRSQPLYLADDFWINALGQPTAERDESPIGEWNPFAPLERVLTRDPFGPDGNSLGSFLVFRKLEQDVQAFKMREEALANELQLHGDDRERAGAMVVGRFRDGTPLTVSKTPGWHPTQDNDFTYAQDPAGRRCPMHAHIRKVNPRGDVKRHEQPNAPEQARMITRRSITYGGRGPYPAAAQTSHEWPSKDVGLLFMCFQANIRRQFAFIQKSWCNGVAFVRPEVGLDTIIGQCAAPTDPQRWSGRFNHPDSQPFAFNGFVRMKGGEFFFAPSIPFFRELIPESSTRSTPVPSLEPE